MTEVSDATREGFSSRWAFWLSAIGCSVGFGNLWRFPYLIYDYGGLAFLIPYLLVTCLIVLPMTVLELGMAQAAQGNCVLTFASTGNRRMWALGLQFVVSLGLCLFYPLLLSWALVYLANSFYTDLPWYDPNATGLDILLKAQNFFESPDGCNVVPDYTLDSFSWRILLAEVLLWVLGFGAVFAGAKVMGKVMYFTMTMPTVFLILLLVVGCTLDGANIGIQKYVGELDITRIADPAAWSSAMGQSLFSIGIAQGTMMAFAGHNDRKQNFAADALVIVGADTMFAFIAGFVVFTVCGYLSKQAGVPFSDLPLAGYGLAFQSYPVGLSTLGYPWAQICCFLFFLTLFLLGLDTVVAYLECLIDVAMEGRWFKSRFPNAKRSVVLGSMCFVFFLWHLLICTDVGAHVMDVMDHFNGALLMQFFCLWESLTCGFFYNKDRVIEEVGSKAHWTLFASVSIVPFLGFLIAGFLSGSAKTVVSGVTLALVVLLMAGAACLTRGPGDVKHRAWWLYVGNLEQLRESMNAMACPGCMRVPVVWAPLVKFVTPVVLCVLLSMTLTTNTEMFAYGADAGPYPAWMFVVGLLSTVLGLITVIVATIKPAVVMPLIPKKTIHDLLVRPLFGFDQDIETIAASENSGVSSSELVDESSSS